LLPVPPFDSGIVPGGKGAQLKQGAIARHAAVCSYLLPGCYGDPGRGKGKLFDQQFLHQVCPSPGEIFSVES